MGVLLRFKGLMKLPPKAERALSEKIRKVKETSGADAGAANHFLKNPVKPFMTVFTAGFDRAARKEERGGMETDGMDRSDRILSEARRRKAEDRIVGSEAETVDLVIFSLNGDLYAFDGGDVRELLPYETVAFVPGCPDAIEGIVNVRGDIESVLDLHRILGLAPSEPTRSARIVMAVRDGIRSGIRVDSVVDVVSVAADLPERPLSTLDRTVREFAVGGETLYEGRYVILLDVGKIFNRIAE